MTFDATPTRAVRPHLAVLHVVVVYVAVRAFWMVSSLAWVSRQPPVIETLAKVALWVVPCVLLTMLTRRQTPRASLRDLGLGGAPWRGIAFGLAATAPMAVALTLTPARAADFDLLLDTVIIGPLAEEVLFRGFLCFQLVRVAGWRILPAVAVSSTMFALAHLPYIDFWLIQALRGPAAFGIEAVSDGSLLLVVRAPAEVWLQFVSARADDLVVYGAPYALGGALFAWIAWCWRSLWPAVALHSAMNFWWVLAQGESRLQFSLTPMSVGHGLAIALAMAMTAKGAGIRFTFYVKRIPAPFQFPPPPRPPGAGGI